MQKKSTQQSTALMLAISTEEKHNLFVKFGFTENETKQMIIGGTSGNPCWQEGNVEWYQAISEEHALKLHIWTFGKVEETKFIRENKITS